MNIYWNAMGALLYKSVYPRGEWSKLSEPQKDFWAFVAQQAQTILERH